MTTANPTPWNPPRNLIDAHSEAEREYTAAVQESNRALIRAHGKPAHSAEHGAFQRAYALTQERFDEYRAARAAINRWLSTH
jgi:hypothetical protein